MFTEPRERESRSIFREHSSDLSEETDRKPLFSPDYPLFKVNTQDRTSYIVQKEERTPSRGSCVSSSSESERPASSVASNEEQDKELDR